MIDVPEKMGPALVSLAKMSYARLTLPYALIRDHGVKDGVRYLFDRKAWMKNMFADVDLVGMAKKQGEVKKAAVAFARARARSGEF